MEKENILEALNLTQWTINLIADVDPTSKEKEALQAARWTLVKEAEKALYELLLTYE